MVKKDSCKKEIFIQKAIIKKKITLKQRHFFLKDYFNHLITPVPNYNVIIIASQEDTND